MAGKLPDSDEILRQTDWSSLEHGAGPAFPETLVKLSGLTSSHPRAVRLGLDHLWDDLIHQGTMYSATTPAALYVAALVGEARGRDWNGRRAELLHWLIEVAYTASDEMQRKVSAWCGYEYGPLYPWIRDIRPMIFRGVDACIHDPDPAVQQAALAAAAYLLDDPALVAHRARLVPLVRDVLGAGPHRRLAIRTLVVGGAGVDSFSKEAVAAAREDHFWLDTPTEPQGSPDEPPF